MKYFGSSGIRGIVNAELNLELAMIAGRAVGSRYENMLVATDARTSREMVAKAFISGVLASGGSVSDMGIAPTPVAGYLARYFDCAAVITASHNPPEYNGIKLMNPDGSGFSEKQMEEIEDAIETRRYRNPGYEFIGRYATATHLKENYIEKLVSEFGKIDRKVVVDTGNGAAGEFTPRVLRTLGCKVLALNAQPDGTFPWRESEPVAENLKTLCRTVVSEGCDAGIAHDGDADRVVVVDEAGNFVEPEVLLCLFARKSQPGKVVVSVDTTSAVYALLGDERVEVTRTGDVYVSARLREAGGVFGGEPSGTYIFPKHSYCPDGIYAAAKLLSEEKQRISEMFAGIPKLHTKKGSVKYPKERRGEIEKRVFEELKKLGGRAITIDGIKLIFDDGAMLVRFSGTEPKIRISAEGRTLERTEKIYEQAKDLVERCII
ncbi:MAG: phosphoglucosamine mutase [Thermoplasmata archaeon]|nr:phosphoglucosamine mutase [Thermoplasmata archaeon]